MNKFLLLVCSLVALELTGCNNPKDVSKSNFEKVINEKLKTDKLCVQPQTASYVVRPYPVVIPIIDIGDNPQIKEMDYFVAAGLLSSSPTTSTFGPFGIPLPRPGPARLYSLTDKGRQNYSGEPKYEFCYGSPQVAKIVEYTEPADMFGSHVTRVTFVVGVKDQADWASDQAIQKRYRVVKPDSQAMAVLELTSEGWKAREVHF